mmetsp:Transcript_2009/g.7569  ORF Transcript_2009/g.7569 Transcript_2009/m.7569 type:complete len:253 (+) Transcript_2009:1721-2479(+)
MTSRALFMSVAESHVILAPMSQLGWVVAFFWRKPGSVLAYSRIWESSTSRKAPPDAVRMILLRAPSGRPWMHWKMALCSESAGRILTPCFTARGTMAGPPAMRVSLLARQMFLPASMAATVGGRPAQPTMPVTVESTSGCLATSTMPSGPKRISGWGPSMSLIIPLSFSTSPPSEMDTILGLNFLICSAITSRLRPAESATISNLSGCSSAMSRVCVPMEPVEPSREIFLMFPLPRRGTSLGTGTRPGQHAP